MAKYIVTKIKGTIALTGGRAFFVPAGFTWRNIMSKATSIEGPTSKAERLGLQFKHRLPIEHMLDSTDGYLCEVHIPVARARAIIQAHLDEMMSAPHEVPSILLPEAAVLELQDALELIAALESKVCKGW